MKIFLRDPACVSPSLPLLLKSIGSVVMVSDFIQEWSASSPDLVWTGRAEEEGLSN